MAIINSLITNSAAGSIFTSAGNTAVTTVYLCNNSTSAVAVNVFAVLDTFDANAVNIIYSNLTIAGNDTFIMESERLLFNNGDFLAANAGVDGSVAATVSFTSI
jgi:hypothetical protein